MYFFSPSDQTIYKEHIPKKLLSIDFDEKLFALSTLSSARLFVHACLSERLVLAVVHRQHHLIYFSWQLALHVVQYSTYISLKFFLYYCIRLSPENRRSIREVPYLLLSKKFHSDIHVLDGLLMVQ